MPTRRQQIETMLAEEPGDVFLRYSLALELEKEGQHDASLARLTELMAESPPYVPAFFMAAQQQVKTGKVVAARAALRSGIAEARRQGNQHAAGEMAELLAQLGAAGE